MVLLLLCIMTRVEPCSELTDVVRAFGWLAYVLDDAIFDHVETDRPWRIVFLECVVGWVIDEELEPRDVKRGGKGLSDGNTLGDRFRLRDADGFVVGHEAAAADWPLVGCVSLLDVHEGEVGVRAVSRVTGKVGSYSWDDSPGRGSAHAARDDD